MDSLTLNYYSAWPDVVPDKNVELGQSCTTAHLVYIRNYRCASNYFYENFVKNMRWTPEESIDIDWSNKTIFSHIAEPIKRRHKGIAHWLMRNNLIQKYLTNVPFNDYINNLPYIDNHSASYHHMLGEKINKVNWILCDYENPDLTIELTRKFLNSHYIIYLGYFDQTRKNLATNELQRLTERVEQSFLKNSNKNHIIEYFEKDINLYYKIKKEII